MLRNLTHWLWDFFPIDFTFSAGQSCSTIDHFFIPNTLQGIILEAGAIHDPENMSGHSPIYIKIDLAKANNPPEKVSRNPRLSWGRSSPEQQAMYTQQLRDLLSQPGTYSGSLTPGFWNISLLFLIWSLSYIGFAQNLSKSVKPLIRLVFNSFSSDLSDWAKPTVSSSKVFQEQFIWLDH